MYKNILIPTDGSELAREAVQHGMGLAKAHGAKITVLTVLTPLPVFTADAQAVESHRAWIHETDGGVANKAAGHDRECGESGGSAMRDGQGEPSSTGIFECVSTFTVSLPSTIAETPLRPCDANRNQVAPLRFGRVDDGFIGMFVV
jgi:hypothetical protein